jgi:hypothetical protein
VGARRAIAASARGDNAVNIVGAACHGNPSGQAAAGVLLTRPRGARHGAERTAILIMP